MPGARERVAPRANSLGAHPRVVLGHEAIRPGVVLRQAGVHRQELAHRHGRRVRPGLGERPQVGRDLAERRVDVEAPLVAQREHDHGDEALRHRADAEGGVGVGSGARLEVAHTAAACVQELAVERDAVGDAGRAELAERLGEERVDGGRGGAHARGAPGIGEARVHVARS